MQEILIKAAVMHFSGQWCVSLSVCARARACVCVCVCVSVRVCVREATTKNNNKSSPITSDANLGSKLSNQPPFNHGTKSTNQPTILGRKKTHASVRIFISQLTHGIHHIDTLTKANIFFCASFSSSSLDQL